MPRPRLSQGVWGYFAYRNPSMTDQYRANAADQEVRKFDYFAPAVTTIDEEHRLTHDGMVFYRTYQEADIPDGAVRVSLFRTGAIPPHFKRLNVTASEGPINITLGENAVVNSLGNQLTVYNTNRTSPILPLSEFYDSTTVFTDLGTPILGALFIPADGNAGVTGSTAALEELVLKPNTDYSISFENDPAGSGTADVGATFVWYEISYETGPG